MGRLAGASNGARGTRTPDLLGAMPERNPVSRGGPEPWASARYIGVLGSLLRVEAVSQTPEPGELQAHRRQHPQCQRERDPRGEGTQRYGERELDHDAKR